jgi:hypothetical protein
MPHSQDRDQCCRNCFERSPSIISFLTVSMLNQFQSSIAHVTQQGQKLLEHFGIIRLCCINWASIKSGLKLPVQLHMNIMHAHMHTHTSPMVSTTTKVHNDMFDSVCVCLIAMHKWSFVPLKRNTRLSLPPLLMSVNELIQKILIIGKLRFHRFLCQQSTKTYNEL